MNRVLVLVGNDVSMLGSIMASAVLRFGSLLQSGGCHSSGLTKPWRKGQGPIPQTVALSVLELHYLHTVLLTTTSPF